MTRITRYLLLWCNEGHETQSVLYAQYTPCSVFRCMCMLRLYGDATYKMIR